MKNLILLALSTLLIIFVSCKKNEISDPVESLNSILEIELNPLAANPLEWTDDELRFLDKFSSKKIVGLGEATHGTAEFFDAKHRIFRYLVENHGYKVFAFEADFGESVFLNAAIQNGNCDQIKEIMTSKMRIANILSNS